MDTVKIMGDMCRFDAGRVGKDVLRVVEGVVIGLEPNYIRSVSKSAVSILIWVRSVLAYRVLVKTIKFLKKEVENSQ